MKDNMFFLGSTVNHFEQFKVVKSHLEFSYEPIDIDELRVSITIPTFRRPQLLLEAVESVARQNTTVKFEVVIVDNDDSKEFSQQIVEALKSLSCNVRYYVNHENIGMFGNWNRCIELANAKKLTILNDDDLLDENWLPVVSEYDQYSLVKPSNRSFNHVSEIVPYLAGSKIATKELALEDCFWGNINPGSLGMLLDKQACLSLGGFNPDLYPTSDYDFLCRYINKYSSVKITANLSHYRWAENESMKKAVLEKFICNDFDMRAAFYNQSPLISFTCRVLSVRYFERLSRLNKELDFGVVKKHVKLSDLDLKLIAIFRVRFFWSMLKVLTKVFL
ncbi:glycosyltransferase family 2 protein [Vibrio hepatarius]|uniref:glycosyltransferase family 2 protein n=1 Tax=Vibrio hepatarius TaxID=171383 RepID=UPI001C07FC76|nr:glycosyltransferase family 2 protein [Vibrio hepatarius]MBU2896851.1 glycosyltransferase [Vibrio hepatarius]